MLNWLVQKSPDSDTDKLITELIRLHQEVIEIPYFGWDATIDLKIKDLGVEYILPIGTKDFICYGIKNGWRVFWDRNFEYTYLTCLGKDFINWDLEAASLDKLKVPFEGKTFVREIAGFNHIKGTIVSGYSWEDWVIGFKNTKRNFKYDNHLVDGNTKFIAATVKSILAEYRIWVVDYNVITSSQYVLDNHIIYRNTDDDEELNRFAERMVIKIAKFFQCDTYVLDVFKTIDGLKVGEINCLNCSGLYEPNLEKLIRRLSRYY